MTRQAKTYQKKIRKKGTIKSNISKGITQAVIEDSKRTTPNIVKNKLKELYRPVIKDKEIMEIMILNENQEKLKTRLEHRITFLADNQRELARTSVFNETLEKVLFKLNNSFQRGEDINIGSTPAMMKKLEDAGFLKPEITGNGKIERARVQTIFRKGK